MASPYERCNEIDGKNVLTPGSAPAKRRRTIPASARRKSKAIKPNHTEFEKQLFVVVNGNALVQFVADVILEGLHLLPSRVNHLSLTFLNAFIAFKTLSAVHKGKFQFLHEDCQFLFLMEICLILGDVYYMFKDKFSQAFIFVRLAFILCSLFNWGAVTYVMWKYSLWHITYQGHKEAPHRASLSERMLRSVTSMFRMSRDDDMHDPEHQPNRRSVYGSSLRSNLSNSFDTSDGAPGAGGSARSNNIEAAAAAAVAAAAAAAVVSSEDATAGTAIAGGTDETDTGDAGDTGDAKTEDDDSTPPPGVRRRRSSFFSPKPVIEFGDDFGAQSDSDVGEMEEEEEDVDYRGDGDQSVLDDETDVAGSGVQLTPSASKQQQQHYAVAEDGHTTGHTVASDAEDMLPQANSVSSNAEENV